jgi:hypothetical protein
VRLAIRAWSEGKLVVDEKVGVPERELDLVLPRLMERLAAILARRHMIEVEFLDEADPNQRYFRFGTDPGGMVAPIALELPGTDKEN